MTHRITFWNHSIMEQYPSMSPYNYCANNPVILVDPDGRFVILRGDQANISFKSLQASTNLKLIMLPCGLVFSFGGKILNDNDQKLYDAMFSTTITVKINASCLNFKNPNGGAYMGAVYKNGEATSTNDVNMNLLSKTEVDNKAPNGSGIFHEITEGFEMGKLALIKQDDIAKAAFKWGTREVENIQNGELVQGTEIFKDYVNTPDSQLYEIGHNSATTDPSSFNYFSAKNFLKSDRKKHPLHYPKSRQ